MYKIFFLSIVLYSSLLSAQSKNIKIIKINEVDYYNIYDVIDFSGSGSDTLVMLSGNKNNKDFKAIKLEIGRIYNVQTRLINSFRISEKKVVFCTPGITKINGVKIANKENLPILILDYKPIKCMHKD